MNPYEIIKCRRLTEKSRVLEGLQHLKSNASVAKCSSPKVVFNVALNANKIEIAKAVELIYPDVKVMSVNTVLNKPKKRRVRGHSGKTARNKKAIVTLRAGDKIDDQV